MLSSFEDSKERIKECRIRIGKIRDEEEKERLEEEAREQERIAAEEKRKAKNRKTAIIVGLVLMCVVIAAISIVMIAKHVKNNSTYEEAIATGNAGHYKAAIGLLNEIPNYKDSTYYTTKYKYKEAMDYGKKGNYRQALTLLKSISDYKDCDKEISKYKTLYKKVEPADICKNYEKYYIAYGAFSALRDKAETLSSSKYASAAQKKKLLELNEFADLMDVAYYSYDDFSSKENGGFDYSTLKQLRGYKDMWDSLVRNDVGKELISDIKPSTLKVFYSKLSKKKYAKATIKYIHELITPTFELAIDDEMLSNNPAKRVKCGG
jgi:hypothetical protein